jgi:hypothetical protein
MPTPTKVQMAAGASSLGETQTGYTLNLPNDILSGNAVAVGLVLGASATPSVTTEHSDTFTQEVTNSDGNAILYWFLGLNITSGARQIIVSFTGGPPDYVDVKAIEFYNVATSSPIDKTFANSGSGTTVTAGSQTTTTSGDLILQMAVQDGSAAGQIWTNGSGYTLDVATPYVPSVGIQHTVQATAGAINPTMTNSNSDTWNSIGMAIKSASSGTAPSATGIRVVGYQCIPLAPSFTTPVVFQMPSSGNLIATASILPTGISFTGVTDTPSGNSYTAVASSYNSSTANLQIFYAANATPSQVLKLSMAVTGSSAGGATVHCFDITGAATAPLDTTAGLPGGGRESQDSGDQLSAGSLAAQSISPSNANELAINLLGVSSNNTTGVSPGFFMCPVPAQFGTEDSIAQNDGCAIQYTGATGSRQYTWTQSGGFFGAWVGISAAFMAPSTGPGIPFEDDSFNVILVPAVDPIISVW